MDPVDTTKTDEIVDRYPSVRGCVITILHEVQEAYGYLPEAQLRRVSDRTGVPLSQLYGIATFYSHFTLQPRGKHQIRVCMGTACHVKGAPRLLEELSRVLDVAPGHTTEDGTFSLEPVRCIGACSHAPIVIVGPDAHPNVRPNRISRLIDKYRSKKSES